jgi:large subunit ribosomal protein L10
VSALPREDKVERVSELKEDIRGSKAMYLTDYRGLTVSEISSLRRNLRDAGAEYKVVKNTLLKRAAEDIDDPALIGTMEGPTAIAFVHNDPIAPARTIVDFMKDHKTLSIKGGYLDGRFYDAKDVTALSKVPPRDQLIAMLVGSLQSPISGLVGTLQGTVSNLVYTLQAVVEKKSA